MLLEDDEDEISIVRMEADDVGDVEDIDMSGNRSEHNLHIREDTLYLTAGCSIPSDAGLDVCSQSFHGKCDTSSCGYGSTYRTGSKNYFRASRTCSGSRANV